MILPRISPVLSLCVMLAVPASLASPTQTFPTCSEPSLTNSKDQVSVNCKIQLECSQVMSSCNFTSSTQNNLSYTTTYTRNKTAPCGMDCHAILPVSQFLPGIHQFEVHVYLKSASDNKTATVLNEQTKTIEFHSPVAVLDSCPSEFITIGSTATCDCVLKDEGFPPGQAIWYSQSGSPIGNPSGGTAKLLLQYSPTETNYKYFCRGVSSLNNSYPVGTATFYPLYKGGASAEDDDTAGLALGVSLGIAIFIIIAVTTVSLILYFKNKRLSSNSDSIRPQRRISAHYYNRPYGQEDYDVPEDYSAGTTWNYPPLPVSEPPIPPRIIEDNKPATEVAPGEYLSPENYNNLQSGVFSVRGSEIVERTGTSVAKETENKF